LLKKPSSSATASNGEAATEEYRHLAARLAVIEKRRFAVQAALAMKQKAMGSGPVPHRRLN
jgi:hypothetical protein